MDRLQSGIMSGLDAAAGKALAELLGEQGRHEEAVSVGDATIAAVPMLLPLAVSLVRWKLEAGEPRGSLQRLTASLQDVDALLHAGKGGKAPRRISLAHTCGAYLWRIPTVQT